MKIKQSDAVKLLGELGYQTAAKWKPSKLAAKLSEIDKHLKEGDDLPESKESKNLLKAVLVAIEAGKEISITVDEPAPPKKPLKKKPAKVAAGKAADDEDEDVEEDDDEDEDVEDDDEVEVEEDDDEVEVEEDDDEVEVEEDDEDEDEEVEEDDDEVEVEEDDEDEEDEPAPKKSKGKKMKTSTKKSAKPAKAKKGAKADKPTKADKPAKKAKKAKGPGVIWSIVEILKTGSKAKPLTKEKIHKELCKRFPDRDADSMRTTVSIQVPSRLKADRDIIVSKNDNGYWIASGKKTAKA